MTLQETIKKMREKNDDSKFYPLIESMKRRADKGLLEGTTSEDIDYWVDKIENEQPMIIVKENINQELFEINEAIDKFNYLDIDDYSEELLEDLIFVEFCKMVNNEVILKEDAEKAGRAVGGVVGTGLAAGAVYHGGKALGWWNKIANHHRSLRAAKLAAMAANPSTTALWSTLGGAGLAAGAIGIGALIHHLRKKRKQNMISEQVFSKELLSDLQEALTDISSEKILELKNNETKDLLEACEFGKPTVLEEAVTFIDNAGNLKTTSTPDYVKSMHEYDTDTQIAKYERKKKKRDYKLISEEIDIDNIKKLSEMSFEDILNEDLLS